MWPLIDLIRAQQSMEHWTFVGARRGMGDGDVRERVSRTRPHTQADARPCRVDASPSPVATGHGAWYAADRAVGAGKRPKHPP